MEAVSQLNDGCPHASAVRRGQTAPLRGVEMLQNAVQGDANPLRTELQLVFDLQQSAFQQIGAEHDAQLFARLRQEG